MRIAVLYCVLLIVRGQVDDDEWIDPTDMLNYDATTKTMRKQTEVNNYNNVPTKRREYIKDSDQLVTCPDITDFNNKIDSLQREVEEYKKKIASFSKQSGCNLVFRRYLNKLLKDIQKLGLPDEVKGYVHYDAEVVLSRQSISEIRKLLDGDESLKPGALDEALSQILINFKPHDYEAWKWRFEDTFGVELDTVVRMCVCVLIIVVLICTELWSSVSLFMQFRRIFAICFCISLLWNWMYLYKIAFAEHQNNIVKMESINDKCTGLKKIDWQDNLKEWFRSTWTLQDDPCKKYYEVLMVNPILLVPPTKAIAVTITTFITEPLKHLGQGISEFLRALLKDLPVTLQIPVLFTIVAAILIFMYGSAQAAIHNVAFWHRRGHHDQPPAVQAQPHTPQVLPQAHPQAQGDLGAVGSGQVYQDQQAVRFRHNHQNKQSGNHRVERVGPADIVVSDEEIDGAPPADPAETEGQNCCDAATTVEDGGAGEKTEFQKGERTRGRDSGSQANHRIRHSVSVSPDESNTEPDLQEKEESAKKDRRTNGHENPLENKSKSSTEDPKPDRSCCKEKTQ
ncbi:chloride channel CLIC-like protein 1 isoform X2 [Lepisosteus oculatus]